MPCTEEGLTRDFTGFQILIVFASVYRSLQVPFALRSGNMEPLSQASM